jgi:addiction module HigA family antidote
MRRTILTTKRKPATIGEILIGEFMQAMELTQAALAEAMGVQRKHVPELCNNRRNAATALILARVFGNGYLLRHIWGTLVMGHFWPVELRPCSPGAIGPRHSDYQRGGSMNSIDALRTLPVSIPELTKGPYTHHPISRGQRPDFYRPEDLRDTAEAKTGWVDFFEKILAGRFWRLEGPLPFAFRTHDGLIRSLDGGCLEFLRNRAPPEVIFIPDALGFIDSVVPSENLLERYVLMKDVLLKRLDPPQGVDNC